MSAAALFAFDDVTVTPDGRPLLDSLTLDIPDDRVTVVVGPSGAGKTTLLRLCNRLDVPSSGRIAFRGKPLDELDPLRLRRRVGMVFQRPTLFPGTVGDNLAVADPLAPRAAQEEVLAASELDPAFLDHDAAALSGGEAQRVCLARTLLTRPEVLLMDEPTASLDRRPRRGLETLAARIGRSGTPIIWVTHDLAQARRLADHLVVLLAGRVRFSGTLDELADADAATTEFLTIVEDEAPHVG